MYYSKETELKNEKSKFKLLKETITRRKPYIIRVGIMKPGIVPYPDENTWKNENSRITVEVYGELLTFPHIGEEVLKWLEEFGYKKDPKTEGAVENDPFEYKEFYMYLEENGNQNSQ